MRAHQRIASAALAALLSLAGCSGSSATPPAPPSSGFAAVAFASSRTPMQAGAFVDSIGVNTHLIFDLSRPGNDAVVVQRVEELGIRHVRDGIFPRQTARQNALERNFFAATHADMLALIDCPKPLGYYPGSQTPPRVVRQFDRDIGGAVGALEGPNEPDLRNVKNWAPLTRACIAGDDRHQALPVPFAASAMGSPPNAPLLGNIAALVDIGGIHRYFSGNNPGTLGFWKETPCGMWEGMQTDICDARINAGASAPLWITETGYTTAGASTPSYDETLDQTTFAKYVSRVLFVDSSAGIARTYLYELQDDGNDAANSEDGYGLIEYDGAPKPAFHAVASILALLKDPGPAFAPKPLRFAVGRSDIRSELFQKRDGTYVLAIWDEVPSWNVATGTEIPVSPVSVTLTFAVPPTGVRYRALDDRGVVRSRPAGASGATVTIAVDDHMAFLVFR